MSGAETFKAGISNGKSCVYDRIHMNEKPAIVRIADIHVSQSQGKSTRLPGTLRRACIWVDQDWWLRTFASRLVVPASLQDRTSICCLWLGMPSQMIEFVFSASPETIRRGLRMCSVAQLAIGETWQPARW